MVRRGLKTTVIATVMAMMLAPSFSAFAQTGKSNTSGSWQVENNAWVFRNAEGQSVKGWVVYNQEWYYLNPENGQLKTGWLQLDGKWYFLSTESGAQQGRLLTGWQWIDGYCYYLMPTDDNNYGVLVVNGRTPDGYYVNQSGQWLHGENGDAVYEAGKGLPSAASSQQVAGASRALPGQVLGASRAIAAPGGGSFGGGGGGGSTGGGATASTTGGAGTATAGATTAGAATGTATGGSAAETTGTAGESATAGGATGASTGAEANTSTGSEANTSTGAESNTSGSSSETAGTTTPSTEGTGTSTGTETPGTQPEAPVTPGQPENSGTETGGNTTEKPGENVTPGTSENTNQPGGTTEETPGTQPEKPGTENGGNTTEKPGTETGGNTTEKPVETETSGNAENTNQPGGTTENSGTENGGNTTEKPGENVTPGTPENTTQPVDNTEEPPETQPENNLKDWPFAYHFEYDAEKKSFLLFFGENENPALVKQFLHRYVEVMVNDSLYDLGDWNEDLIKKENKYIYALKWDIKEKGYFNALRLNRAAFHEGINTLEFAPDGYKPVIFNFNVTKGMLQDLKKLDKLQYQFEYKSVPGSYNVKIVKFENLNQEQKQYLKSLKTLEVDGVSYTNVDDQRYEDLCAGGRHVFMLLKDSLDIAIGNPPQEYGVHRISLQSEDYEDIEISYEEEKAMPAPTAHNPEKKAQGYYELSFEGDRADIQNYLKSIKSLTVAGRTYGQMASFRADLLKMGEKFSFGDSTGDKKVEDLLLFSIPTVDADKKQEILIEAEGYEVATIPLS
ncbi:hypothetical protein [Oribacterium sinus]